MPTTAFIKNLDVTFEIVSPPTEQDFYFSLPEVKDINVSELEKKTEVQQPVFVAKEEEQITFSFDMPIAKSENKFAEQKEERLIFELTNETKEIKVNMPLQVVPVTELNETGVIRYSLEEYMEVENQLLESKPLLNLVADPEHESLKITSKIVDEVPNHFMNENISPTEMSLDQVARLRADERRKKLKEFNYKFHSNASRIDEIEKEPAYKRLGVDISSTHANNNQSRTSLGTDSNNDIQLRSNNSFLHDNVD